LPTLISFATLPIATWAAKSAEIAAVNFCRCALYRRLASAYPARAAGGTRSAASALTLPARMTIGVGRARDQQLPGGGGGGDAHGTPGTT